VKVTLREVARRAQVHYATASTILNGAKGSTRVSEETRGRVLEVAGELGYSANRAAQQLKTRRSRVVGLLTGGLENPFFARMVSLCSEALEREGCDVILATRRRDETSDLHLLEALLSRQLGGVLVWSETLSEVRERVQQSGMANVVVMGLIAPGRDSVGAALDTGVRQALEHLEAQGCERIGYFAPRHALNRPGNPRDKIYREKMAAWGRKERIFSFDGTASDGAAARAAAEALADAMARQSPGERPDALLCLNDINAIGAMMGLRRKGLRVPEDIALVGCDDLPLAAQLDVPLTTIAYPLEAMCRAAVRLLIERIRSDSAASSEPLPPRAERLQTRLVVRESSSRGGAVLSAPPSVAYEGKPVPKNLRAERIDSALQRL
jgi:LacI family transcriptional regulator